MSKFFIGIDPGIAGGLVCFLLGAIAAYIMMPTALLLIALGVWLASLVSYMKGVVDSVNTSSAK